MEPADAPDSNDSLGPERVEADPIDLDAIERDLADVEIALARLESGTYWTCEATGETLDDVLMEAHPTARRLPTV